MNVMRWSSARVVVVYILFLVSPQAFGRVLRDSEYQVRVFVFTPAPPCGKELDEWLAEFEEKEFVELLLVISCGLRGLLHSTNRPLLYVRLVNNFDLFFLKLCYKIKVVE